MIYTIKEYKQKYPSNFIVMDGWWWFSKNEHCEYIVIINYLQCDLYKQEIITWFENNNIPHIKYDFAGAFLFEKYEDALLFHMTWN